MATEGASEGGEGECGKFIVTVFPLPSGKEVCMYSQSCGAALFIMEQIGPILEIRGERDPFSRIGMDAHFAKLSEREKIASMQ